MNLAEIGFIYILEHDAGNMVKVGETSRDPKLRGDEYIKQYQLKNFTLKKEYKVPLNARRDVEKRAHKKLDKFQLSSAATGGAREIFNCSISIARTAVEEAIAESEIAKVEAEKQRLRELELQRKARAAAKMATELEAFTSEWLKDWETSDWLKSKTLALDSFLAKNPLETEGFLPFKFQLSGYVLSFGCGLLGIGIITMLTETLASALFTLPVGGMFLWGAWSFYEDYCTKTKLVDQEAVAEKEAMEDEIAKECEIQRDNAKKSFALQFTLEDFYD